MIATFRRSIRRIIVQPKAIVGGHGGAQCHGLASECLLGLEQHHPARLAVVVDQLDHQGGEIFRFARWPRVCEPRGAEVDAPVDGPLFVASPGGSHLGIVRQNVGTVSGAFHPSFHDFADVPLPLRAVFAGALANVANALDAVGRSRAVAAGVTDHLVQGQVAGVDPGGLTELWREGEGL